MPELPEVERAAKLLRDIAKGKKITRVETFEDSIVFSGTTHQEFGDEITGRIVDDAQRYGKVFYLTLSGEGKHPVLHFGMTGMLQVKGSEPVYYKEGPMKKKNADQWPPRFFVLHLSNDEDRDAGPSDQQDSEETTEVAFLDARRLELRFDPIYSMPSLEAFSASVLRRSCPIKALLLDQSFSAGVGNWVADEILYHARVHPEQRCNTLSTEQIQKLHHNTVYVTQTAVDVNADDKLFPENWLFKHRWTMKGKGKRKDSEHQELLLPSGAPATIKWITVGGRTSAYVVELQAVPKKQKEELATELDGDESDLTPLEDSDDAGHSDAIPKRSSTRKRKITRKDKPTVKDEKKKTTKRQKRSDR
ncbi:hypothetical protein H1R20_g3519, partial [Candolleomyces eurysporus]